ncbi:CBS domain-containing protein [Streptomyces griseoaurantiacus]|uniref:hypothetical protein n=1 Tax=Streptomyces griseoaurantiacus TaxID=68213 RepID=UPI0035ABC1A7
MTHTAVTVGRYAPFKGIVTLMRDRQAGALPVLEGEGRVVGVASERICASRRGSATATRTGSHPRPGAVRPAMTCCWPCRTAGRPAVTRYRPGHATGRCPSRRRPSPRPLRRRRPRVAGRPARP